MTLSARELSGPDRELFLAALRREVTEGRLGLGEAARVLRVGFLGLRQDEFARFVGVSTGEVTHLEGGLANPTVRTLDRVFAPFGMKVGLVAPVGPPPREPSVFSPEVLDAMAERIRRALERKRVRRSGARH